MPLPADALADAAEAVAAGGTPPEMSSHCYLALTFLSFLLSCEPSFRIGVKVGIVVVTLASCGSFPGFFHGCLLRSKAPPLVPEALEDADPVGDKGSRSSMPASLVGMIPGRPGKSVLSPFLDARRDLVRSVGVAGCDCHAVPGRSAPVPVFAATLEADAERDIGVTGFHLGARAGLPRGVVGLLLSLPLAVALEDVIEGATGEAEGVLATVDGDMDFPAV